MSNSACCKRTSLLGVVALLTGCSEPGPAQRLSTSPSVDKNATSPDRRAEPSSTVVHSFDELLQSAEDEQSRKRETLCPKILQMAEEALSAGDFQRGLDECAQAGKIAITDKTRDLRKRLSDAQKCAVLTGAGDRAMQEKDYEDAAASYAEAQICRGSPELETKYRHAKALILIQKAHTEFDQGHARQAEDLLNASRWYHPTQEADQMLTTVKAATGAKSRP